MINTYFVNTTHMQNNKHWAIISHSSQSALLNTNAVIWLFAFSFVLISYEFDPCCIHCNNE